MTTAAAQVNVAAPADGLRVSDLHKEYPTPAEPLVVLRGVSLEMRRGESLAVIGPSGSGKSTLLNILGTLDRPSGGAVALAGEDPFSLDANALAGFRSRRIGFVFQDHHLLPQCTALENVLIPKLAGGKVRKEDIDRAATLLDRVGLAQRRAHLPSELSGGERQRVAIARAQMNSPALLLCDEPTGNLDPASSRSVGEILSSLASVGGAILVVVTHSTALAGMFQRRMRMDGGRLIDA